MEKISVIVPVYNVEEYLAECIDSILNQTYENLEIILVNDGSDDISGDICDDYKKTDSRIKVIHKGNGGLSSARNSGIEVATGKYLGFVDSDDLIAEDMYEVLYKNIQNDGVDIATVGQAAKYKNQIIVNKEDYIDRTYTNMQALKEVLTGYTVRTSVCNKLYKRSIFDSIKFPVRKAYEDAFILVDTFLEAKIIHVNNTPKYYYRRREGSITYSEFSDHYFDVVEAYTYLLNTVVNKAPELIKPAENRLFWAYRYVLDKIAYQNKNEIKNHKKDINDISKTIRQNLGKIMQNKTIQSKTKFIYLIIAFCPRLYMSLSKYRQEKKNDNLFKTKTSN